VRSIINPEYGVGPWLLVCVGTRTRQQHEDKSRPTYCPKRARSQTLGGVGQGNSQLFARCNGC